MNMFDGFFGVMTISFINQSCDVVLVEQFIIIIVIIKTIINYLLLHLVGCIKCFELNLI